MNAFARLLQSSAAQTVSTPNRRRFSPIRSVSRCWLAEGARTFSRLAEFARLALVNGAPGILSRFRDGRPQAVLGFTVRRGKSVAIDILADPARLRQLDLPVLDN